MKSCSFLIFCLYILCSCSTTTYYVVRHAEKTSTDCTAPLAQLGFQRAEALKDSLLSKHVDSIFVSTCLRTQQTAQPLATAMGKTMIEFEPTTAKTDSLIRRLNKIRGKKVLIVGHANTIPAIILGLSGMTITPIADTDFDNLYTVRIRRFFGTTKTLVHTTYGVITN